MSYNDYRYAVVVQLVERLVANEKVAGSNPVCRSKKQSKMAVFILSLLTKGKKSFRIGLNLRFI